jgi:pantetheine-phosphate adenylyltransferase
MKTEKIAIYSGCFDPPTLGHVWVMRQAIKLFDSTMIVIGPNPGKKTEFSLRQRRKFIRKAIGYPVQPNVMVREFTEGNIVDYINDLKPNAQYYILRGIRDVSDYDYEANIAAWTRRVARDTDKDISLYFLLPPKKFQSISSSAAKRQAKLGSLHNLQQMIPKEIFEDVVEHFAQKGELGKLGPCPQKHMPKIEDGDWSDHSSHAASGVWMKSASSHIMPMTDEAERLMSKVRETVHCGHQKMRGHFRQLAQSGFISFSKTVTADQVRDMLDPFPRDVVASETFTLTTIPIDMVRPIGERYIPCSQSLGPIIVDVNEVMRDHYDDPYLIIEGKHRWLDAKERGEGTIMAWVGDKVKLQQ